jgi:hypothetical protein
VLAALLAGCGGGSSSSAELVKEVRGYQNGLRWRDFAAAALRVRPSRRSAFLDAHEQLDRDLRVVDWEMTRLEYEDDRQKAVVHVEYTWLLDSRGIVHTTVSRQFWARHGDHWLLEREERLRGEPMPGIPEPGEGEPDGGGAPKGKSEAGGGAGARRGSGDGGKSWAAGPRGRAPDQVGATRRRDAASAENPAGRSGLE